MTEVYIRPAQQSLIKKKIVRELLTAELEVLELIKFKQLLLDLDAKRLELYGRLPQQMRSKGLEAEIADLIKESVTSLESVECRFNYFQAKGTLKERVLNYWPEIVEQVKKEVALANGWLANARCQLVADNRLVIELKNELGIKKLRDRNCEQMIAELITEEFEVELEVEFKLGDFSQESQKLLEEKQQEKEDYVNNLMAQVDQQLDKGSEVKQQGPLLGKKIKSEPVAMEEIQSEERSITIQGQLIDLEVIELKSGKNLLVFVLTDHSDSLTVKVFENDKGAVVNNLDVGDWLRARGKIQIDQYDQELTMLARDLNRVEVEQKSDDASRKRIELHLHTKMSAMDSVVDLEKAIERAADWGHSALAITDHGVIQSFPEAHSIAQSYDVDLIYGLEAYLVDDGEPIVINPIESELGAAEYVVFDLETTGLNPQQHQIIELGAVKIEAGEIVDSFNSLVNPDSEIPAKIVELTGIDSSMVAEAPRLEEVLPEFLEFIEGTVLVAHNLSFDLNFINNKLDRLRLENPALDTLNLARALLDLKSFKLNRVAQELQIELENHHRASEDARVTAQILLELFELAQAKGMSNLKQINSLSSEINYQQLRPYHATILVKNQTGLKNLYKLVSKSHIETFYRKPRILKSQLLANREGLILGSACEAGQLYQALLNGKDESALREIGKFYDYFEVQPLENTQFLIEQERVESQEELKKINRQIYELGTALGKPVIATGDVHFLDPKDEIFREILMTGQGFEDADSQAPLYYRTTEEMLAEFDYFSQEVAEELVIENPNRIVDEIEEIKPIPEGLFTPEIEGAVEEVQNMTYQNAQALYGEQLPEIVEKRLAKELDAIIGNGFAVIYLISHKLVKKSLDDGYLVGSRGSVGSSLVATMCQITEVNPLPPHYICPKCQYSEFFTDGDYGIGFDLPDRACPDCEADLIKEGADIPFEVFMGFEGKKVPDIDLNFSGKYQPEVHSYTEELFGEDYVFRAGTISTIADRTAYGFVKGYIEENSLSLRKAEVNRLAKGCTGVRRTTGQHPGGLMVVPQDKEIFDFTPIQKPANDQDTEVLTTHFDYHSISGRILKLDILGHDDPTTIRMLEDMTGVDAASIPLDDPETMAIFSGLETLGIEAEELGTSIGSLGIPEFGTDFVQQMLEDTQPTTFAELVRISGLSHGENVWLNNAQDLIKAGKAELAEVISVRDDIMNYLIQQGVEPSQAFWIMEHVRKGKGLTEEEEASLVEASIPNWYIKSCKKIEYMFPKAHAVAYVMMAFRIAFFKVHYPQAFYTAYFTIKATDFDAQLVAQGQDFVEQTITKLRSKGNDATQKEKNTLKVLEIVIEAMLRGVEFTTVDLYQSSAHEFQINEEGLLLPPLITLQGLGESAAQSIIEARNQGEFTSIENLSNRAGLSKTVIEVLKEHGCLEGLPATNQLSMFT
ncbi:PolC-type DNA polymerase III [Fuchsiella alkaliacetigena]|uniref:PolC-type DNA polymerase III n=1 Tax=Fuchsiella alkaliacetigena TaxID=957042 RepID=UPI00200A44FC|nr:PolC-type DNA polymerase III [Fuchsiella alkaliacetigena]MCK8823507.1 PolC-type DNA polymerase III [Fuchsiella alkaliacetigena]